MSLRVKVNLFFSLMLMLSLVASASILVINARQAVKKDMEETMNAAAQLITVSLAGDSINREQGVYQQLRDLVKALSEIRSLHILLFDSQGLLIEGEPKKNDRLPPQWFIELLLPDIKPLAKRFGSGHLVIYAAPLQEIQARWQDIKSLFLLGLAIFILVGIGLYWSVGWLLKPLERLLLAISGFEQGDFHIRLPRFSLPEMDKISQAFNRLGEALALSISENQRLATLVKQSGDAILSIDRAGYITFCNPAAERLFGAKTGALLGEHVSALEFIEQRDRILTVFQACDKVENLETALQTQADKKLFLLLSTVPLVDKDKVIQGVICTLRDITEHKQAEATKNQLRESRSLAQHMADVQEAERRHLARELHDELGQCLTAIKTDAVLIRNRTEKSEPKAFTSAQAIIDVASHIYDVVHNMITRLRPSPLDDLGLQATLEESIAKWQQRQPDIQFELNVEGELSQFDEMLNMTVFRIVQEAITNAVRHAQASTIQISIQNTGTQLELKIEDDGKGMVVQDFHSDVDFGLLGMRERAHSLGGCFKLESEPDKGVKIHITLPLRDTIHHE